MIDSLTIASGGIFGENFDPASVVRQHWDSAILTFDSCNSGLMTYFEDSSGNNGVQTLSRLTALSAVPCDPEPVSLRKLMGLMSALPGSILAMMERA